MKCPCRICIVDAVCNKACTYLHSYLKKCDLSIPGTKKLPEDLPKNVRVSYRVGKMPAHLLSDEMVGMLRIHFNDFNYEKL